VADAPQTTTASSRPGALNWPLLQSVLFLGVLLVCVRIPGIAWWPWYLLVPIAACVALSGFARSWGANWKWLALGRGSQFSLVATAIIALLSIGGLVIFQWFIQPDLQRLAGHVPQRILGSVLLAGLVFSVSNAMLEEIAFRGVLYEGLLCRWGWRATVGITSLFFGLMHAGGYPPGPLGALLAGGYGALLGWLRHRTGGILWPIVAHVAADATIFAILVVDGWV